MESTPRVDLPSVFLDSSALFAASLSSSGSARDLILAAARGRLAIVVSRFVLQETQRNLAAKAPRALPYLTAFRSAGIARIHDPSPALVTEVAQIVVLKDAPIVAGAIAAGAPFLASYDRKHLLQQAALIHARFGITVDTPDSILHLVRHETSNEDPS